MITQRDVANAAGVSLPTAQLALNDHPRVSARTTLHVQTVAKRLGYIPNHAARQLIRSRYGSSSNGDIHQFGVLSCVKATKRDPLNLTDMAFLNGVEEGIASRSGVLVYLRHANEESARQLTDLTRAGTVEGWIVFGHIGDESAALLDALGRPWVVLGDHACSRPIHQAKVDFRLMGRLAVQHLAELGYRHIAFVGSHMHYLYARETLAGFREAMATAALAVPPDAILTRESCDDVRSWIAEVLSKVRDWARPPTALVCAQPGESATVLSLCEEQGIRVPDDVSIVFCEMADSLPFVPGVARIEASAVEAGRSAVSLLADVAGRKDPPTQQLLVTPRTVPGTTAATVEAEQSN